MNRQRLTGIDLFRGLAIYAVIVLHSDEPLTINPTGWQTILEFSKFAVPFFLAASFYLAFKKFYSTSKGVSLRDRLSRLLIPYGIWSAIYLLYKCFKYVVDGEMSQISQIPQNWFSIIFSGGAAFHLYFLPLLMAGTVLLKLLEIGLPRDHPPLLVILAPAFGLSLVFYQGLLTTGNAFNNGAGTAFVAVVETLPTVVGQNLLVRAGLITLAWMIRCLPYILLAMLLAHPKLNPGLSKKSGLYCLVMVFAFVVVNLFGILLPAAVYEILRGYITLVLGLAASPFLKDAFWLRAWGACSFGIYLMHLIFIEGFYILASRALPASFIENISSITLLLVSVLILILTGFLTQILRHRKKAAFLLLGG
ncbi:MAG: acyltransferase [Thermosynechococcaceae cyanobacterium]